MPAPLQKSKTERTAKSVVFGSRLSFIRRVYWEMNLIWLHDHYLQEDGSIAGRYIEECFAPVFSSTNKLFSEHFKFRKSSCGKYVDLVPKLLINVDTEYWFTKPDGYVDDVYEHTEHTEIFSTVNDPRFKNLIKYGTYHSVKDMFDKIYYNLKVQDKSYRLKDNGWISGVRFESKPSQCKDTTKWEKNIVWNSMFECHVGDYRLIGIEDQVKEILKKCLYDNNQVRNYLL